MARYETTPVPGAAGELEVLEEGRPLGRLRVSEESTFCFTPSGSAWYAFCRRSLEEAVEAWRVSVGERLLDGMVRRSRGCADGGNVS